MKDGGGVCSPLDRGCDAVSYGTHAGPGCGVHTDHLSSTRAAKRVRDQRMAKRAPVGNSRVVAATETHAPEKGTGGRGGGLGEAVACAREEGKPCLVCVCGPGDCSDATRALESFGAASGVPLYPRRFVGGSAGGRVYGI